MDPPQKETFHFDKRTVDRGEKFKATKFVSQSLQVQSFASNLRKKKKNDIMADHRKDILHGNIQLPINNINIQDLRKLLPESLLDRNIPPGTAFNIIKEEILKDVEDDNILACLTEANRRISADKTEMKLALECGIIDISLQLVDHKTNEHIQTQAFKCLTLLSYNDEYYHILLELEIIGKLCERLNTNNLEQVKWCLMTLRNLYIKGGETRSIVEETNLFDYLFFAINQDNLPIPLLREIVSTIYLIFTESKAQPLIIAKIGEVIPRLFVLITERDGKVITNALWCLADFLEYELSLLNRLEIFFNPEDPLPAPTNEESPIFSIYFAHINLKRLLSLMSCTDTDIRVPCLRIIRHTLDQIPTLFLDIVELGLAEELYRVLSKKSTINYVAMMIETSILCRYLVSGGQQYIQLAIDQALVPLICKMGNDYEIKTSQYVMGVINNSNAVKRLEKFLLLKNDDVFNMTNQVLETINSYSQVTAESGESA